MDPLVADVHHGAGCRHDEHPAVGRSGDPRRDDAAGRGGRVVRVRSRFATLAGMAAVFGFAVFIGGERARRAHTAEPAEVQEHTVAVDGLPAAFFWFNAALTVATLVGAGGGDAAAARSCS